jgi:hypothetical protein
VFSKKEITQIEHGLRQGETIVHLKDKNERAYATFDAVKREHSYYGSKIKPNTLEFWWG